MNWGYVLICFGACFFHLFCRVSSCPGFPAWSFEQAQSGVGILRGLRGLRGFGSRGVSRRLRGPRRRSGPEKCASSTLSFELRWLQPPVKAVLGSQFGVAPPILVGIFCGDIGMFGVGDFTTHFGPLWIGMFTRKYDLGLTHGPVISCPPVGFSPARLPFFFSAVARQIFPQPSPLYCPS